MFGLYNDPAPLPSRRLVVTIAPATSQPRQRADAGPGHYSILGDFAEEFRMRELWRMHKAPHLYDGWHRDLMDDLHTQSIPDGKQSYDCDTCRMAVIVDTYTDTCPRCGQ